MQSLSHLSRLSRTVICTAATLAGASVWTGCTKPEPLTPEQQTAVGKANPQMQAVLNQLHEDGGMSFSKLTVAQARSGATAQMAAMEVAKSMGKPEKEEVGSTFSTTITSRDGYDIPVKVYKPTGTGPWPVLVYYHGGGWVVGAVSSANPYDGSCRILCNSANCTVVSVDYRLAPEHPYPAAVNDSFDAYQYVVQHADKFSGNGKVAVGGESAGGNLSIAVSLMAKDMNAPLPSSILSAYPVGGAYTDTPSAMENAMAIPLDTPSLKWFYEKYVPNDSDRTARYFDIEKADLHGLPPTTVITDQIDPLNSDGKAVADKLKADGVHTRYQNYDGVTHEFFGMGDVVDTARQAEDFAVQGLKIGFNGSSGM